MGKKKPEQKPKKSPLQFLAVGAVLLAIAVFAFTRGNKQDTNDTPVQPQQSQSKPIEPKTSTAQNSETPDNFRMPAYFEDPGSAGALLPTLDPEVVDPGARAGYKVAKEKPDLLTQLPCFCYCDRLGHSSLYTCFETKHAESCEICLSEAIEADQMDRQGMTPQEIRQNIVERHHPRGEHSHS